MAVFLRGGFPFSSSIISVVLGLQNHHRIRFEETILQAKRIKYLRLKEAKSGTDNNLTEYADFNSENLDVRYKRLRNMTNTTYSLKRVHWTIRQ